MLIACWVVLMKMYKVGDEVATVDTALAEEHHDRWMGFEREDVRKWLSEAGFSNVRVSDLDERCCTTPDCGRSVTVGIFVASASKLRGVGGRVST